MAYTLRGTLSAYSCDECTVSLEGVTVRAYAPAPGADPTRQVAADPRHTFRFLHHADEAGFAAAHGQLLGEGTVLPGGTYSVGLSEAYDGAALDIDLYCGTVGGRIPPHPHQIALTTIQPVWRSTVAGGQGGGLAGAPQAGATTRAATALAAPAEADEVAAFDYTIPSRLWCATLARLGLWVVCGRVTVCDTGQPVGGVTVSAFDRDWLQDDALGSAVTDVAGRYQLWYTAAQFSRTPWSPAINIELVPGPDLYFRVEGPGSTVLLDEPPDTGRTPGRQNIGPCACIDLCVPEAPPRTEPIPAFRYIGTLDYLTDVDSGPGGTGRTLADDRAFYSGLRLSGPIGTTLGGAPLEYRFEVRALPSGSWTPVLPSQILPTMIGTSETLVGTSLQVSAVVVNGTASATEIAVAPAADGWIPMPAEGNLSTGLFTPNLNMIVLDSRTLGSWPALDVGAVSAGSGLPAPDLASDRPFGIRLRVRQAGVPASETDGGECPTLAIDNTLYDHVNKGGSWSPSQASGQLAVVSVDIQELLVNGCVGITTSLTALVTAAHPNLGAVSLSMTGSGSTYGFTLPAPTPGEVAGVATNGFTVSSLPTCAYIVTLQAEVLLTTGDNVPDPVYDQLAFCKK